MSHASLTKFIGLRVTCEQFDHIKQQADLYGTDVTGLLRILLLGKIKGLKIKKRPPYNTRLLGDALGHLIGVTGALNQNGINIRRIAERLEFNQRDLFGLDGALQRFDQCGQQLLKTLHLMDAIIKGRHHHKSPATINNTQRGELSW